MAGDGFKSKEDKLFMVRCFECERENWAMAVVSGQCAWCGYKMKEEDLDNLNEKEVEEEFTE